MPPFDHPDIWAGVSTMIPEISRQLPEGAVPDAEICSVGVGGLFTGIVEGIGREASPTTQVLAVETLGADSLVRAVEKRELVALPEITSIALGAPMVSQRVLDFALQPNVSTVVVEDAEACTSCLRFVDDERNLVEPAYGASLALAYSGQVGKYLKAFSPGSIVVVVVCGGSRIDLEMMNSLKTQFGMS